jgi:hypothetical protein
MYSYEHWSTAPKTHDVGVSLAVTDLWIEVKQANSEELSSVAVPPSANLQLKSQHPESVQI